MEGSTEEIVIQSHSEIKVSVNKSSIQQSCETLLYPQLHCIFTTIDNHTLFNITSSAQGDQQAFLGQPISSQWQFVL